MTMAVAAFLTNMLYPDEAKFTLTIDGFDIAEFLINFVPYLNWAEKAERARMRETEAKRRNLSMKKKTQVISLTKKRMKRKRTTLKKTIITTTNVKRRSLTLTLNLGKQSSSA